MATKKAVNAETLTALLDSGKRFWLFLRRIVNRSGIAAPPPEVDHGICEGMIHDLCSLGKKSTGH